MNPIWVLRNSREPCKFWHFFALEESFFALFPSEESRNQEFTRAAYRSLGEEGGFGVGQWRRWCLVGRQSVFRFLEFCATTQTHLWKILEVHPVLVGGGWRLVASPVGSSWWWWWVLDRWCVVSGEVEQKWVLWKLNFFGPKREGSERGSRALFCHIITSVKNLCVMSMWVALLIKLGHK